MIANRRVVAVIPSRGGSKGINRKNLTVIGGLSLLERTILLAQRCTDCVEKVVVTTDDPEMHEVSTRYGAAAPELRPAELAGDSARSIDVLRYVIELCGLRNDYIMMLQPTSPLRTSSDLRAVVRLLQANPDRCEAAVSVAELDSTHPDKVQVIADGYLTSYIPGKSSERPRQELPLVYKLNGAFYLTDAGTIVKKQTLLPERTLPYVMPPARSVNLDHPWDLVLLQALLAQGAVELEEYGRAAADGETT